MYLSETDRSFIYNLEAGTESVHRQKALLSAAKCYSPGCSGSYLKSLVKADLCGQLRAEGYGSVIVIMILITILGAAISWAVERLLDWLFPHDDKGQQYDDHQRLLAMWQSQWDKEAR